MAHLHFEIAIAACDVDGAIGKSVSDSAVERVRIADHPDGLNRRGKIGAVAGENRRIGADLRSSRRRIAVGVEMIVETPVAHAFTQ